MPNKEQIISNISTVCTVFTMCLIGNLLFLLHYSQIHFLKELITNKVFIELCNSTIRSTLVTIMMIYLQIGSGKALKLVKNYYRQMTIALIICTLLYYNFSFLNGVTYWLVFGVQSLNILIVFLLILLVDIIACLNKASDKL